MMASMSASNSSFLRSASFLNSWNARFSSESFGAETQLFDPLAERVPAAVLAQYEVRLAQPDVFRTHDFVCRCVLQHAVLMDAGFVREGVLTDDGLVARDMHAGDARHEPARRIQLVCIDAGRRAEVFSARMQRHDDFFQRAVAGAFADAVDGALDLPGAGRDRGQAVGDGHAQVVVAVHAQHGLADARYIRFQVAEQLGELDRHRVTDSVRNVDRPRAGLDHGRATTSAR